MITNPPGPTAATASELLREAGTDPKYDGLFTSVQDFHPPAPAAVQAAAATLVPVVASEDLAASMARLSRRQRMALAMWAYADADVPAIARALELDANAAHQLLHRAKAALRQHLKEPAP